MSEWSDKELTHIDNIRVIPVLHLIDVKPLYRRYYYIKYM